MKDLNVSTERIDLAVKLQANREGKDGLNFYQPYVTVQYGRILLAINMLVPGLGTIIGAFWVGTFSAIVGGIVVGLLQFVSQLLFIGQFWAFYDGVRIWSNSKGYQY